MSDNVMKIALLHNERDDTWSDLYEAEAVDGTASSCGSALRDP